MMGCGTRAIFQGAVRKYNRLDRVASVPWQTQGPLCW
jgi:hypothetical protein